ncbi:MAG TPA: MBL fold metallo-hydrolase [Solirubrobacteraceae bacterium]|nr:MBL fold metallo-hydrolase [Solirubrobacteraceae bacterium]
MDVRMFTVGQVQENSFLLRRTADADRAVLVDPGDEADKLLGALDEFGVGLDAILLTHTHFDHVGAVAPVATATGAPVYCPALETQVLADIMSYVPWPGFGPFESWEAEETVAGGERLRLAGFDIDVHFTPGHSPGHVTYAFLRDDAHPDVPVVLASGDVLFQQSIGRTDLPGGDHATLMRSIADLAERYDDDTVVLPGHMGVTSLGAERAGNPFLQDLPARQA